MSLYFKENPAHFRLSLDSILNQTIIPDQIVIVIDGPVSDELNSIVTEYASKNPKQFTILQLLKNSGMGIAFNHGLNACRNDLVARMDTDDIAVYDRFEKQIQFFQLHPEISILGGTILEFINSPGDINQYKYLPTDHISILRYAKYRSPFSHATVMYRKEHVIASGSYKLKEYEDYFLWIRMFMRGYKAANLKDVLVYSRIGNKFIERRLGLVYAKREIKFCKLAYRIHFFNYFDFIRFLAMRIPLRFIPRFVLAFIYKYILRNQL